MNREYNRWHSPRLGREMEMLIFGQAGLPVLVFPTSCGRFYEFEERGMVATVDGKVHNGHLQLFCVDSVDGESWYNRGVGPDWRIARHVQYETYVLDEVLPLIRQKNGNPRLIATGCSFGGFHAANIALKHPELFAGFLSMSGAFDLTGFLDGFYNPNCYFNLPMHYLPNMTDPNFFDRYRHSTYVLATGVHDQCWNDNEVLAGIMRHKGIPHQLDVWGNNTGHDWPWWQQMLSTYL